MSDPESFLSRWSRRKREALRETDVAGSLRRGSAASSSPPPSGKGGVDWGTSAPQPPDPPPQPSPSRNRVYAGFGHSMERSKSATADFDGGEGEVVARPARAPTGLPFDPASLPPIQSITADTDIRGFLASGVPSELTRAALRRAWACDPKIRNFVGLAEYDWDFNAADSMPGFGPLQITDEVGKMAAQIVEPGRSAPEAGNLLDPAPTIPKAEQIADKNDTETARGATAEIHDQAKQRDEPVNGIGMSSHPDQLTHRGHERVAVQHTAVKPDKGNAFVKRRHGGALPK